MVFLLLLPSLLVPTLAQNLDRFIYDITVNRTTGGTDFGPPDWNRITCPNLTNCIGYPDTWWYATEWSLPTTESNCRWCPSGGTPCNFAHRQSPIELTREVADPTSDIYSACTDDHWMQYTDSSCTWQDLQNANAFSIERHALKLSIPIHEATDGYRPACPGGRWGVIDFSNGFKWWRLSHTEIHIPSEHTQNGKRYDAEIQMHHLYSLQEFQMATIAFFVKADDNVIDDPFVNKLICEWRKAEDVTREQCGLPSVKEQYPGCWPLTHSRNRNLRSSKEDFKTPRAPKTAYDIMAEQQYHADTYVSSAKTAEFAPMDVDRPPFDVEEFLRQESSNKKSRYPRQLIDYNNMMWFNYWPMLSVRTEYYHSYLGTATVPPCFGSVPDSEANMWHLMKDPIRISPRQLDELNRLLVNRIAPVDDEVNPCQPDTAGVIESNGRINVARPLQQTDSTYHDGRFCSCENWHSKWPEDRHWCEAYTLTERLTTKPYNFLSNGY